eukprot:3308440-Rhodomonas_salina.5
MRGRCDAPIRLPPHSNCVRLGGVEEFEYRNAPANRTEISTQGKYSCIEGTEEGTWDGHAAL